MISKDKVGLTLITLLKQPRHSLIFSLPASSCMFKISDSHSKCHPPINTYALYRKSDYVFPEMKLWGLVPNACICEGFIYFPDRSAYLTAAKLADRSWEYINRSQIHECGNWETDHYNFVLEIRRPHSFISGNTQIGTRHLFYIGFSLAFICCVLYRMWNDGIHWYTFLMMEVWGQIYRIFLYVPASISKTPYTRKALFL